MFRWTNSGGGEEGEFSTYENVCICNNYPVSQFLGSGKNSSGGLKNSLGKVKIYQMGISETVKNNFSVLAYLKLCYACHILVDVSPPLLRYFG